MYQTVEAFYEDGKVLITFLSEEKDTTFQLPDIKPIKVDKILKLNRNIYLK